MNIVPSRFACLRIEDDENASNNSRPKNGTTKKIKSNNSTTSGKSQKSSKSSNKPPEKQEASARKQRAAKRCKAKQWEEWKEKDKKLIDGTFERDLENAIFMSMISYEESKEIYDGKQQEPKKPEKNKKKQKVMSLDQFLSNDNVQTKCEAPIAEQPKSNKHFFDKICAETKSELSRDAFMERFRERQQEIDEVITISQYEVKLNAEKEKNLLLQNEIDTLKEDITIVKERNKILYSLLSTGEMKGKVEIIYELEKLQAIKDELTQEVSRLHGLLEQERSKVAALMDNKKKKNGKK